MGFGLSNPPTLTTFLVLLLFFHRISKPNITGCYHRDSKPAPKILLVALTFFFLLRSVPGCVLHGYCSYLLLSTFRGQDCNFPHWQCVLMLFAYGGNFKYLSL